MTSVAGRASGAGDPTDGSLPTRSREIADYAMIGDLHTAAMVSRDGSIDWLCFPRFDSPACFAALLGDESNGHWLLAPSQPVTGSTRRYRDDALVLETEFSTETGAATVIDFMPPNDDSAGVVRIVRGLRGTVEFRTTLRMRFDYGRIVPWVRKAAPQTRDGIVGVAGPDALYLRSDVELEGQDHTTGAEFSVAAGQDVAFVLTWVASNEPEPAPSDPFQALADTESFWTEWVAGCAYDGPWSEQVRRSVITLKALTYAPTGGIAAAATTSLPELIGGERNWDYRFCWLRDSTFVLDALTGLGFTGEAVAWRDWLLRAVAGDPSQLQVLYAVDGTRRLPELELPWLAGFAGSAPVRIGNAATEQLQLDIYGELLNGLALSRQKRLPDYRRPSGGPVDPEEVDPTWGLQVVLCEYLETIYRRPDRSLWEVRGEPKQFVHSKVMCWVAFDRMVQGIEEFGLEGPLERWTKVRDELHAEICEQGVDSDRGCFVQHYGSNQVDAALLLLPSVGFLPWDDPRVVATVQAVRADLADDSGLVRRYLVHGPKADAAGPGSDGVTGGEGCFVACSYWLVSALAGIGEAAAAQELFVKLLSVANDVGLMSEEYDGDAGRLLGNMPQAYSHVGLLNAARRLQDAKACDAPGVDE